MNTRQNDSFAAEVLVRDPLDVAVEWIKQNLSPGDVFDDGQIADHARANIEIDTIYSENNIIGWVQGNLDPSDVFSDRELSSWAEANGY